MVKNRRAANNMLIACASFFLFTLFAFWFTSKVVRSADSAASAFIAVGDTHRKDWKFDPPFTRTNTLTRSDHQCHLFEGDIVETAAKAHDVHGNTALIHACFGGWQRKGDPPIYFTDIRLMH